MGVRLKNEWIENSKTWKSVIEEELQTLEEELEAIVEEFEIAKERKEEIEVEQKEEQDRLLAEWEERQAAKKAAEEAQAETAQDSQEANTELDATSDQDAGEDVPTTPGEDEEENFPYPAEYAAPPQGGKATEEEQEEEEEENFPYPAEYAAPSGEDEEESEDSPEDATDDEEAKEEEKEEEDKDEKPDYQHPDMGSARSDFTKIQKERTSKENDIKAKKEMLETDFGGDNEWYPMYKNCYDVKIKQYTYEICPFDKSTQKEGSSRTNLGTYKNEKWNSKEGKMFFEDGQKCWNGPKRSLEVRYECRDEVKVLSVDEPSKCVYVAIMGTPAACDEETLNGLRLASDFGLDEEEGHH